MKGKTTKENIKNIDISLYVKNDRKTNVDWCIY